MKMKVRNLSDYVLSICNASLLVFLWFLHKLNSSKTAKFEDAPCLFAVNSRTFAMKITEVTEFCFKSSLEVFVKSKSTSENITYRVVAIVLVL